MCRTIISTEYRTEIKAILDLNVDKYNRPEFIASDPIQIPHLFALHEDIEIAGFLTATLAWGQRATIIRKSKELMDLMGNRPYEFVTRAKDKDFSKFEGFCHRTFNTIDCLYFLSALHNIYTRHGGLRQVFEQAFSEEQDAGLAIINFRKVFFETDYPDRTRKHVPDITRGSAAKRMNMFLRWMVRKDNRGVDFGLWKNIDPAWLCIPLDLHTGLTSRNLGLLSRRQNDWQAVIELTQHLREFDPSDPVKYDYALFGLSAIPTPTGWGYPVGV